MTETQINVVIGLLGSMAALLLVMAGDVGQIRNSMFAAGSRPPAQGAEISRRLGECEQHLLTLKNYVGEDRDQQIAKDWQIRDKRYA